MAAQHLDSTEDLSVCLLTLDQVRQLLVSDKIRQALMAAPLWKYFATRGLLDAPGPLYNICVIRGMLMMDKSVEMSMPCTITVSSLPYWRQNMAP